MGKVDAQKLHAAKRFRERLPPGTLPSEIGRRIRNNESVHVWRQSDRVKLHVLEVDGRMQVFVYDTSTHVVVTVLPEGDDRLAAARRKFPVGKLSA